MKISDIVNFEVKDKYVETPDGSQVYFLRLSPPNLNIMTDGEKGNEIQKFQEFYDSLGDLKTVQIFSLDKTENLSGNKAYWCSLIRPDNEDDPCIEIKKAVIRSIESIESTSSSVGRAFYFVLKIKDPAELSRFETSLNTKGIHYYIAEKQELVTVHRNFILREFVSFDIYDFEKEVNEAYENAGAKKKAAR